MMFLALRPAFLIAFALGAATHAQAELRASAFVATAGSSVRLILPDAADADGWATGGVEIRLDHGAKTYWRTPGETGVPTTAVFTPTGGVSDATLQFPAPKAFDDGAGGIAYGYLDSLIVPIRFRMPPQSAKGTLGLSISYGVCQKNMCMPAEAQVSLGIGAGTTEPGLDVRLKAFSAAVPRAEPLNSAGPVTIVSVTAQRNGKDVAMTVATRVPAGTATPDLFVEGADTYSTRRTSPDGTGEATFSAVATDAGAKLGEITITLVAGQAAIETKLDLDALAKRP